MRARDLMNSPAITCLVDDTLDIAAQKMWDHDIGVLAVVDGEGRIVGMVTDRDVCMATWTQGRPLHELLVGIAMANQVVVASPDTAIRELERLMSQYQIRRIPVVDPTGVPLGIISVNDLALVSTTSAPEQPLIVIEVIAAISRHRTRSREVA